MEAPLRAPTALHRRAKSSPFAYTDPLPKWDAGMQRYGDEIPANHCHRYDDQINRSETCDLDPSHPEPSFQQSVFTIADFEYDASRSPSPALPSPNKSRWSFINAPKNSRIGDKKFRLEDWFQGESNSVSFNMLPPTMKSAVGSDTWQSRLSGAVVHRSSTITKRPWSPAKSSASAIAFLSNKLASATTLASAPSPAPREEEEEEDNDILSQIDICRALEPEGPYDSTDPESFAFLYENAESLASDLQAAYRKRTRALQALTMEKKAQAEELEEANLRSQHLKRQLSDMSSQKAERDALVARLQNELEKERRLRKEENEARRSVRLVGADESEDLAGGKRGQHHYDDDTDDEDRHSVVSSVDGRESVSTATSAGMHDPREAVTAVAAAQEAMGDAGVMAALKGENAELRERVRHLEAELEACIDLVQALGIAP